MKIFVKVKPNSKKEQIDKIDDNHFVVRINALPIEGRANKALIKVLAEYFNVPSSAVEILSGEKTKQKVVEIII